MRYFGVQYEYHISRMYTQRGSLMSSKIARLSGLEEARKAVSFIGVLKSDKLNRPLSLLVPGHDGRRYQVILRREPGSLSGECLLEGNGQGHIGSCEGSAHSLCYHVLASVLKAAQCNGRTVSFTNDARTLKNLKNVHSKSNPVTFTLYSVQSGSWCYGCSYEKEM